MPPPPFHLSSTTRPNPRPNKPPHPPHKPKQTQAPPQTQAPLALLRKALRRARALGDGVVVELAELRESFLHGGQLLDWISSYYTRKVMAGNEQGKDARGLTYGSDDIFGRRVAVYQGHLCAGTGITIALALFGKRVNSTCLTQCGSDARNAIASCDNGFES